MQQRTVLILNSLSQILSRVVTLATRFFILPFAIAVLGRTHYGVWIVVGQIFAYTRILEAGLRGAVVRQVAVGLARGDTASVNRYVNSACGYFALTGLAILGLTAGLAAYFPDWFHVAPEYAAPARLMVLISGAALALTVMQYAYTAVLSGMQREDFMSATQLGGDLLMMLLIFTLLQRFDVGGGLIAMAAISGGCTLLGAFVRTAYALRICPNLTFRPWRVEFPLVREMAVFGVNTVIYMMAVMVAAQLAQIVIAAKVSAALATDFRVAMELIVGVHTVVIAATIAVKAAAGRYAGTDDHARLRTLLIRSTRYAAVITLGGVLGLMLFADPFLTLWQGHNYPGKDGAAHLASVERTTRILALGFGTFWLLMPAFNVINGMGRHHFPARLALASGALSMLAVLIAAARGATAIETYAWAVVAPVLPTYGVVMTLYGCRTVGEPLAVFLYRGFLAPLLGLIPAVLAAWWTLRVFPVATWVHLGGQLALFTLLAAATVFTAVLLPDDRRHVVSLGRRLIRTRGGESFRARP